MADLNELRAQVEILRWAKARKAELADLESGAKAAIQEAMGDDDTGTIDGVEAITWKSHKRSALDQAFFKKTYPEVYENCKVTSEVRRFEVNE